LSTSSGVRWSCHDGQTPRIGRFGVALAFLKTTGFLLWRGGRPRAFGFAKGSPPLRTAPDREKQWTRQVVLTYDSVARMSIGAEQGDFAMSKFRIMIVDDEEDVRTIERLALSTRYEVVESHDGLDALEKLERTEPDFAILDVMMPLMNGFETCRAIRKHPKFQDIPVLFLSASREHEAIKEGYGAGANLYLTKPFDPERLVKNVDYYLQESRARPRPKRFTVEELSTMKADVPIPEAIPPTPAEAPPRPRRKAAAPPKAAPPKAQPKAKPSAPAEPEPPPPPSKPRVVIVEDDSELRDLLTLSLEEHYEVLTAEDGIEGVEKIVHYQPDLIVLDAMLPKMSGYQLCTSLRRNQNYRKTPIIFVSAKASQRDKDYCRRLGANEFVAKPFEPADLARLLLSYTTRPDFALRPKRLTIEQIHAREQNEVDWLEERERHLEARRHSSALGKFIKKEMS
jgi:CheY-like chemotaxis protein